MTHEQLGPKAVEQGPSLREIREKARQAIEKMTGQIDLFYDTLLPGDLSREIHALDEIRKFAVETGLLTQMEIGEIKSPRGYRGLAYERDDLNSIQPD